MTFDISLISNLNSLNLVNQLLNSSMSANSLNSLLGNTAGSSSLLSATTATSKLSANLATVSLITTAGSLTVGNPLSVFSSDQDAAMIEKAVTNFVTAFNKTVTSLSGSSSSISNQYADSLKAIAGANSPALEAIGITIDNAGKFVVDSAALKEAAASNPEDIQTAFNDTTFVTTVAAKAKSAVSQMLGLTSGAGFLTMYTSSLSSGASGLLSRLISGYL
ncbi:MAG: flagellar filament capping protein FliD [bacterium]